MDTVVCCPYLYLATVADICKGSKVKVGAQVHD
jgi:triosephosphate isomerase